MNYKEMKKVTFITTCLLFMVGHATMAQLTSAEEVATPELVAKREMIKKSLINNYMTVKQMLIASDSVSAGKEAVKFIVSLDQFKFKKLNLTDMNESTTLRNEIRLLALRISETNNINTQRKTFSVLSEKMWIMSTKVKPQEVVIYQQVCPMIGDTWLSLERDIKNPYYPKNMLTCGEVKQSI